MSGAGNVDTFDVAVIGAGVVGCAVARRFVLEGARVVLLEKGADLLSGASKANSAILHTGFDAPPGSIEVACMQRGYAEYLDINARLNLPLLETGAVVAAWTDEQVARLDQIEAQARENGVDDVQRLDRAQMLEREPHLAPDVLAGLLVPREHVIDPWSAPLAYLTQAVVNGGTVAFDAGVTGAARDDAGVWHIATPRGAYRAKTVVNCAGLYGDTIEALFLGAASFEIRPRKGQFVVLDKVASTFIRTTILPVPTERTKGVVIVRTAFGNVLVGPTAEEQQDRVHATIEHDMLRGLLDTAARIVPALAGLPVTAAYAGLRPATEDKGYRIRADATRGYLAAGGIRSTGLTAALGIAHHLFDLYRGFAPPATPLADAGWPRVPNLAEHRMRDWERPGRDEIVCHCEFVTRREIEAALEGPLPARDFGGLKRRTRACMGRCQGFYCSARVAALSAGRFGEPLAAGELHE